MKTIHLKTIHHESSQNISKILIFFFCFNGKILFTSGDCYGGLLVTRLLINWASLLSTKLVVKDSLFTSVLSSLYLKFDKIVYTSQHQFIPSGESAKTVQIILFEICLKVSMVKFLLTVSYLNSLPLDEKRLKQG